MTQHFDPSAAGLYVHVPFCASLCGYCDFYRVKSPAGVPEGYEDDVLREARQYSDSPQISVDTVFIGGGTPSLLEDVRLERLFEGLRAAFAIAPGAEVTLEANPETVTQARLNRWKGLGLTRLSVGVQSLSPGVLQTLERRAGAQTALQALRWAAEAGFEHLSADCMIGVPGQTDEDLRETVEVLASMPLDHLSVYGLDLHRETPLWDAVRNGALSLPGEDETADLWEWVHHEMTARGFEHYEISNFAKPGGRCRHNLRTWMGGDTIGLGPAAWSRFRGELYGNPRDLDPWAAAVRAGTSASESREVLSPERQQEDDVIFGLRVADGVELAKVRFLIASGGRDPDQTMAPLVEHGYAAIETGHVKLTPKGFLASNEVLSYLLPARWPLAEKR